MSSFLNRLKNLKTGSNTSHHNESDTGSISSFDEEGFLCPICHRKFPDTIGLEHHYLNSHAQGQQTTAHEDSNGLRSTPRNSPINDPLQEATVWKQQFCVSEENRMKLSTELMHQRQRAGDLEEELTLLHEQLRKAQAKVIEQSQEIGNLKASKDVSDAQLAMFTDELLLTQGELKQKQNQVDILCNDLIPRPTNDDVDVLKHELIGVQQRMNEYSLEKEQQLEQLRRVLIDVNEYTTKLNQLEDKFELSIPVYNDIIHHQTSQIHDDISQVKNVLHSARDRKEKLLSTLKYMRNHLDQSQSKIDQLKQMNVQLSADLEHQSQLNEQLNNDLQNEQKQINSYRIQIERLTNENQGFEKALDDLKQEKNQLLLTKADNQQDEDGQNLVRQLIQEQDEYQQQIKELRKQIQQITDEKQSIHDEYQQVSKRLTQLNIDKNQLQDECVQLKSEVNTLQLQLDNLKNDKEQKIDELNEKLLSTKEHYVGISAKLENDLRETTESHKQEIEQLENNWKENKLNLTEQINRLEAENNELKQTLHQQQELINETKSQLNVTIQEKLDQEKQLEHNQQTMTETNLKLTHLCTELDEKNRSINRLTASIRHCVDRVHKTQEYIQQNIDNNQQNILNFIEQSAQESLTTRMQTLEDIRFEFINYLTVMHTMIINNKNKQTEEQQQTERQLANAKAEYDELSKAYEELKCQFEIQVNELNNNLSKTVESLTEAVKSSDLQRDKFEKQKASLENELTNVQSELESRTKKSEMQLSALTENLATLRGELKTAHEKLSTLELIKTEKTDLQERLSVTQQDNRTVLERSLIAESRNEKLLLENGILAKKNSDLESALQEIAREYQRLQVYTNKLNERRWLDDHEVHACMKCGETFTLTQRKHHCRSCGNIFCDSCSSKTSIVAASSKKPQRVCDQCFQELTSS